MTMSKRIRVVLIASVVALCGLQLGEQFALPGVPGFITDAEARVGRPLTPVSVAGVGRRTARRCRRGVYNC